MALAHAEGDKVAAAYTSGVEVLEFLDKIGATRRVGDARIILRDGAVFG